MSWNPMSQQFDEDDEGLGLTSEWPATEGSPLAARFRSSIWPATDEQAEMGGMTGDDLVRLAERELHNDENPPRPS